MYTWSNNKNDDLWNYGEFNTAEECIKEAVNSYEYNVGDTIAVGEAISFEPFVSIESMLEKLEDDAYEECGEAAENWHISRQKKETKEAWDQLQEDVNKAVMEYLNKIGEKPTFYRVDDIREITITEEAEK